MSTLEINAASTVCRRCGMAYSRLKGFFPVSYGSLYKGTGFVPYCRDCIDKIFITYVEEGHSERDSARQTCRKLDLYWSDKAFDQIESKATTRSVMNKYMAKLNMNPYIGKCYDDTLKEEGTLWLTSKTKQAVVQAQADDEKKEDSISNDLIDFWGPGFTIDFYLELERRYKSWTEGKDITDQAEIALYKQICLREAIINRDTALGKDTDKSVNSLNTLLGSVGAKPTQKKEDIDSSVANTPFGVWIKRFEDERPIPEPDEELMDVDGIVKYISTWFLGHLCKMLGIKNTYCKLYEDEMNKLRIERPEYEEEDDEDLFNDIFGSSSDDAGGDDQQ